VDHGRGSPTRYAHTYTHGRHGAGDGAKSAQRLAVEPGAFLSLYKIAHSESMVDGITSPSDFSTIKGAHCGLEDVDSLTVRAAMTLGFLDFSKSHGNDFSTPRPCAAARCRDAASVSAAAMARNDVTPISCNWTLRPWRSHLTFAICGSPFQRGRDSGEIKSPIGRAESVQPELAVDRANFGRLDQARMRHGDRVQRAFELFQPKVQELI